MKHPASKPFPQATLPLPTPEALERVVKGPRSRCLITGCALVLGNAHAWGDLHSLGGLFIFHSTDPNNEWLDHSGGAIQWRDHKSLRIKEPAAYFWRRGVFVIAGSACELNPKAHNFLSSAPF